MSTIEMKYKALNLLMETNKDAVIKQVLDILSKEDSRIEIERSRELENALLESEKSFEEGKYSGHNDVMERMKNKFPNLHK